MKTSTRTTLTALLGAGALTITSCGLAGGGDEPEQEGAASSASQSAASSAASSSPAASPSTSVSASGSASSSPQAAEGEAPELTAETWDAVRENAEGAESVRVLAMSGSETKMEYAGAVDDSYVQGSIAGDITDPSGAGSMELLLVDGVTYVKPSADLAGAEGLAELAEAADGRWVKDDQDVFGVNGQGVGAPLGEMDLSSLPERVRESAEGEVVTIDGEDAYRYTMSDGSIVEISADQELLSVGAEDAEDVIRFRDWDEVDKPSAPPAADVVTVEELQEEIGATGSASPSPSASTDG